MKTAVVTGAGLGIGQAIAIKLAADGNHIAILEFNVEAGEDTAQQIRDAGGSAEVIQCDVSSTHRLSRLLISSNELIFWSTMLVLRLLGMLRNALPRSLTIFTV